MSDNRSLRIAFFAHCLLNQNAKVAGLATHPGIFTPLIPLLVETGTGVIQLPCPEFVHLGPSRPVGTDTIEQYDTPEYRSTCFEIARRVVTDALSYEQAGYKVLCIVGVEGSPSCGVSCVPHLVEHNCSRLETGMGIFIREIHGLLKTASLNIPLLGIPELPESGDLPSSLFELRRLLSQ